MIILLDGKEHNMETSGATTTDKIENPPTPKRKRKQRKLLKRLNRLLKCKEEE